MFLVVQSSCFNTSLKVCLVISFVVSSLVLTSSAGVVTCFSFIEAINGSLYFNLCELWYFISQVFVIAFLLGVHSYFQVLRVLYFFSKPIFGIQLAVKCTEDIRNSFSGCDCLASVIFHLRDDRSFPSRCCAWKNFWCLWIPPESAVSFLVVSFFFCLWCTLWSSCSVGVCLLSQCSASPQWVFWSHPSVAPRTWVLGSWPHTKRIWYVCTSYSTGKEDSWYSVQDRVQSRAWKDQQAFAVTNSIEFKNTWIRKCSRKNCETWARLLNPRIHLTKGTKVSGKSAADSVIDVVLSSSALLGINSLVFDFVVPVHRAMSAAVSIKVSLVLGVWLRDVRHLVFVQLHTVQVPCVSNWILRRISSALHTVNRLLRLQSLRIHFPLPSIFLDFCHFDPCVVALYFIAFRVFSVLWLESLISSSHLFKVFPQICKSWFWWWGHGSMLLLSLPVVHLGSDASLIAKRHFILLYVFQSSMGFWLQSSSQLPQLCFISCIQPNLLLQFRLCQYLHRCHSWRKCGCLGRNLCLNWYLLQFLHLSFCGLLSVFVIFLVPAGLSFLFVFSLCLDEEAKHFALSRSYHSFMFLW